MLKENTLFGEVDKEQEAIELLKEHEPPEGYFVAFSGGKDSIVVYDLVRRAGVKHDVQYSLTTVDPPELIYFIKEHYPHIWETRKKPKLSMWQLIEKHGFFPTRYIRYCCGTLKETAGRGRVVVTGVRAEESARRAKRKKVEVAKDSNAGKMFVHPIFDWTSIEVWEYIKKHNLPYCKLYDEGFDRIGCIMCPLTSFKKVEQAMNRWPKYVELYKLAGRRAQKRMLERKANGEIVKIFSEYHEPDGLFNWWIKGQKPLRIADSCDSIPLFSEDDGSIL